VIGKLPRDAELELKAAAEVGKPGSAQRRQAIARAYRYVEINYPQYLKEKTDE
jgi:hypothetical protein